MKVIYAPNSLTGLKGHVVFLAGSIEMNTATEWQEDLITLLSPLHITVLNPRRYSWDSSWKQEMSNPNFYEQVNWELQAMDIANTIFMYFDPSTKAPITLLELGLYATSNKLCVCCPEGFWRKGNVDIVCAKYNIPQVTSLEEFFHII